MSTTSTATDGATDGANAAPAYRDRSFLGFVLGQATSELGDQVWYVALSWSAVHMASPAIAGLAMTVASVPRLALMLFGGALVDRRDARRMMIGSDTLRAVVTLAAAGIALASPGIMLLVLVSLVFGVVDAVFMPASNSLQPRLLEPAQYGSGNALIQLVNRLALTLGAPLGGLLVAFGGLALGCLVDAATFVVSVASLWFVRPRPIAERPDAGEPYFTTFRNGLRYLVRHRVVGPMVLVGFLINLGFIGPMNVGLALLSHDNGWGATGVGLLLAGFGIGAASSAFGMLRVCVRGRVAPALFLGGVLEAGAMMAMALSPTLWLAVGSSFVIGVLSGFVGVYASTTAQHYTDDAYRGRVGSVVTLAALGIGPQAMTLMGVLDGAFGLTTAFAVSAAMEAFGGMLCVVFPGLRAARATGPTQDSALAAAEPATVPATVPDAAPAAGPDTESATDAADELSVAARAAGETAR
jgi:MFS family permease